MKRNVKFVSLNITLKKSYSDTVRSQLQVGNVDKRTQVLDQCDLVADKVQICQLDKVAHVLDMTDSIEAQIQ